MPLTKAASIQNRRKVTVTGAHTRDLKHLVPSMDSCERLGIGKRSTLEPYRKTDAFILRVSLVMAVWRRSKIEGRGRFCNCHRAQDSPLSNKETGYPRLSRDPATVRPRRNQHSEVH